MTKCFVKNCNSTLGNDSGVTLHEFPSSVHFIKLWLQRTGNVFSDLDTFAKNVLLSRRTEIYRICSNHFSPNSYMWSGTEMTLKSDAIPTIFQEEPKSQDIAKTPLHKTADETGSCLNSLSHQSTIQASSPPLGPVQETTEAGNIADLREVKNISTCTGKLMVDKSIGTDPQSDLTETKIEKLMNKRLLNLAMEIISLLTGEEYMMVKKHSNPATALTSEVPIKCGDVSIYFTMEEWDYIEDHKDHYQKAMKENDETPSSPASPAETVQLTEVDTENVNPVLIEEDQEDGQSKEDNEQVDISPNTSAAEFSADTESGDQTIEDPCVMNSWEPTVVHEDACTEQFKSIALHGDAYTMSCSSGDVVEDNKTVFHGIQNEESTRNFCLESPKNSMENLACTSTSDQCDEQAWTMYERFVGDPNYPSREHLQIKEESNLFNYSYNKEPPYADQNVARGFDEHGQLFDTVNNLLVHQIAHSQSSLVAKPYACNHCDKRFAKRSHLGMHLKTHTGEKPYACPDCGKMFSRRSNMVTHYRTHTGEKPFACPKCGKRFTQSSHMVTHQRTHSSDKLFTCPECKKCFTKWSYLNFHLRTHGIEKLCVP